MKYEIQMKIDRMERALLVSLDLYKAFDTVNHEILLKEPSLIGVWGSTLKHSRVIFM